MTTLFSHRFCATALRAQHEVSGKSLTKHPLWVCAVKKRRFPVGARLCDAPPFVRTPTNRSILSRRVLSWLVEYHSE